MKTPFLRRKQDSGSTLIVDRRLLSKLWDWEGILCTTIELLRSPSAKIDYEWEWSNIVVARVRFQQQQQLNQKLNCSHMGIN